MEKFIVDGLVLLVFVVTVIHFARRGFAKTVLSAAVTVGAVIVANLFGGQVGQWLNTSFIESNVVEMVRAGLEGLSQNLSESMNAEQIQAALSPQLAQILSFLKIDVEGLAQSIVSGMDISALAQQIGGPLAATVSQALGIVITFVVAVVVLKVAAMLVDGIFHLPVLRTLNGFMGCVLGVIVGFCLCLIFANLFHVIMVLLSGDHPSLSAYILPEGSVLYSWLLGLHF